MMSGGWVVLRKYGIPDVERRPCGHHGDRQPDTVGQLSVQRLRNACRTGGGIVRLRLPVLGAEGRGIGRRESGGDGPRTLRTFPHFDERREEQQHLRENRHACERVPHRRCQTAPGANTHGQ